MYRKYKNSDLSVESDLSPDQCGEEPPRQGRSNRMTEKTDFDFFVEIVREMKNKTALDDKKLLHLLGRLGCALIDVKNNG